MTADDLTLDVENALEVGQIHPTAPGALTETFDWCEDSSIVLREQSAVAVYTNNTGDLVIRQERRWDEDDDTCIIITKENAQALLDAVCTKMGIRSIARK